MNTCTLSGRLVKNATTRGSEPRVLSFVLETRQGANDGEKKERTALIPCVIFNPPFDVEKALTTSGKNVDVEFEGRLSSSSYQVKDETRHTCEVIVKSWTIVIQPRFGPAE